MKGTVAYKMHTPPDGKTKDLSLKVSAIDNGWIIKAGGSPYYCKTAQELDEAIADVVARFVAEVGSEGPG